MSANSQRILQFWRDIEIFHLPDFDKDALPLSEFDSMPWEMDEPLKNEKKSRRFTFYIGKVAKNNVIKYLGQISGGKIEEDWMEPVTGDTCLAAIMLDEYGRPYWNSYVHASYIHGIHCMVQKKSLSGINNLLAGVQSDFEKRYNIETKTLGTGEEGDSIKRGDVLTKELLIKEMELLQNIVGGGFSFERDVYWIDKEVAPDSEIELPILNSFYLDDLNLLMNTGDYGKTLKEYLSEGTNTDQREDMIADKEALLRCLHPALFSPGRWPSPVKYGLYTAQQGAVNAILSDLKNDQGIRGINGPPGTGKTTLLLDIIADCIVSRAKVLLETGVNKIFESKANAIETENKFKYYYYNFGRKELFEGTGIVVSSNNNRAVENISMELPSVEKIDRDEFPDASYFADCASRLLKEKESWGVLSAPFGRARNRYVFRRNFWESDGLFPGFKDYLHFVYKDETADHTHDYIEKFEKTRDELRTLLQSFYLFQQEAGERHLKASNKKKNPKMPGKLLEEKYGIDTENIVDTRFLEKKYEQLHLSTPYASPAINRLRSLILIKSLELHEHAILANARKFKNALSLFMEMITGRMKVPDDVAPILWNTFFFCVPVVSTTLASAARLFKQMGRESLGWLLLDEAGQATPQSAAGIIWRSKRCIIVGDPLQIEPVVTHPEPLIKFLRKEAGIDDLVWSPLVSSVQSLGDRMSTRGTYLGDGETPIWSGFPLRAHRRCDNPMFELANKIAYEGQMVKATKDESYVCVLGPSSWFNVDGYTILNGHIVDEEIALLKQFINTLIGSGYDKDIYVITPFTSVKIHCEEVFEHRRNVKCGTVHTFQGQEAEIVFLVLGSDPAKEGARKWVTQNVNMINVALTRARRRFYLIGNKRLWGKLPFINQFKDSLPVINVKQEDILR
ncbi:ATP-binding protein [Chitinophaga filiformis]|uniref:DEAD/DEAH box helicase n=1 Tax=Chitinophaga filiformis TaxID=104663 RepID=UPI001F15BEF2|nr:ATP-binding protein [Chitinophaga filiformis]MCF6405188.1 ATP-binding protein [Chitinophaga filiformis]